MRHYYMQFLLLQVILPLALLISIGLRPFGMSMVYVVLFLLSPLPLCRNTQPGSSNKLLLLSLIFSFILLLVHAAWHTLLTIFKSYGWDTEDPMVLEIAHNVGLIPYKNVSVLNAIFYLSPELLMSLSSLVIFLANRKLEVKPEDMKNRKYQSLPFLISVGQYFSLFLIMWSGILTPSVTNGVYFLVFLLVSTWWAIGQSLGKKFAVVGRCMMAIMAVHAIILMVYQVTYVMELLPPDVNFARYFGLLKIANIDISSPDVPWYEGPHIDDWTKLASLLVILFTYYVLALETTELFKPKAKRKSGLDGEGGLKENGSLRTVSFRNARDKWASAARKVNMSQVAIPYISSKVLRGSPVETTPLIRKSSRLRSQRWTSKGNNRVLMAQDSSGSIVMDAESEHTAKPTLTNEIVAAIIDFFQILIRSSYIATTITMMAWSILYHSWLTFVFLMWANIVWLCHDQRSFMLKTSPILVFYATVLLIIQYVYGMDLTVQELPSDSLLKGINFRQIGISRPDGPPFVPLLVKSLFTVMFWITLRQRMQEIKERRQEAVITDLAAPLKVTVSTAASVLEDRHQEEGKSRLFHTLGVFLRALCARYWIYVVAIMLFVIGITGERMTIFRIIYMFLFLAFILMFQISWYLWRRCMYMFWIVVIIYSMINLILIYVYQFDNFSKIIEQFLYIDEVLQHDLGLEPYHPADLFVKLLTPTCFLIITIMQVHYFHKDFMKLSDPYNRTTSRDLGSSRPSQGASTIKDDIPPLPLEEEGRESAAVDDENEQPRSRTSSFKQQSRYSRASTRPSISFVGWLRLRLLVWKSYVDNSIDLIAMYLEIHLIKIVFVGLMLLCTLNVCAMHVPIMVLICPALWLGRRHQRVCVLIISTLISVYLMSKMVYQIDYIRHEFFECNCTTVNNENVTIRTYNNAEWVGFNKILHFKSLASYLKGYIGLMAIFTFFSLILYRQEGYRERHNIPDTDEKLLFPNIRREDADKDLLHCIKYLLNYGFYKFGVETTLICMMGVIGSRMDLCAIIYAGWLIILIILDRNQQARLWRFFTGFLTVIIPFQYCLAVGVLPYFCVQYPWSGDDTQMKHVRSFVFLPHAEDSPHAAKLIFDYFLLLFATLQLRVFAIERQYGKSYAGGSNSENIGKHWETPNFVNPIPDFTVFCGNWLDVVKRMIFLGMLWVTLAIMFMTGTNRVNLFSMGYLVGSFIFLWQGTDFYLLPKSAILLWWSWLLRYNVSVVVVKTLLQIPGCIFGTTMQTHACWLVQLLGIGCVDKFAGGSISRFIRMDYIKGDQCSVPQEDIGLAWDGVCFAFLILQKRLFHSYYFYRVIDESKATTVLASRGAELIEQLRQRQMQLQRDQEVEILEKIKVKMEKIKANQKRIQGISKEPETHEIDEDTQEGEGESEQVPLVRGDSDASGRGYHTPDSPASPRGFHTPISEPSAPPSPSHTPPSPSHTPTTTSDLIAPLPALPAPLSSVGGPPSPSSALLTSLSLDAYLEPRRISFGSPPSSDLVPRAQSPEESYPVFSPPPIRRRHTVASPSVLQRTSIISQSSRSEPKSHQDSRRWECPPYRSPKSHQQAIRSGDYYMFDDMFEQSEEPLKSPEGKEEDADAPIGMGLGKLVSTIVKTDLNNALILRRASMPSVRRSSMHLSMASQTRSVLETRASSFRGGSMAGMPSGSGPPGGGPSGGRQDEPYSSIMDEEPPEPETWFDKVLKLWETVSAFISSLLISVTRQLMKYSRDYRYVSQTLTIEKKILKEREGFGIGIREGAQMRWEPLPEAVETHRKLSDISVPEIRLIAPSMERGLDASPAPSRRASPPLSPSTPEGDNTSEHESAFSLQSTESKDVSLLEEQDDSMFKRERAPIVLLIYALWYAILAHTDVVCYIMVFINQIQSATILSIPLPLMVFLWGTLTIPRPTKIFWVTMIAYTEVIVLIKSMFQFEILPWNQKAIPADMPFTAPRIIGIERKSDYALYDLLLLLIIFLHRFMLKSLGLWKESKPEVELREEDTMFSLKPEDTSKLVEGKSAEVGKKYLEKHEQAGPHRGDAQEDQGSPEAHEAVPSPPNGLEPQEPGPSKPLDDDHYNVNDDQEPIIAVTTAMENPYNHCPRIMWMSMKRYLRPPQRFFQRMLEPTARVTADIYAYMFLCDFINFLVIIFGFAAFGTHQGDGGVQAYLEENKVPIPFLVMLILQFALIVIDRALYLRKFMLGKILFQYALIIGVHVWMFFILPFITERTFNALLPPPMWYMVKCVYLLLSAYQIRCGYPRRIIGNFLCKSYRFVNMISFRGFMGVPFVFELRTLMDWVWTDTSMNLMDWLKMEDIFANVYLLKCSRYLDSEYPQARGAKKSNASKYMLGGSVLVFVIAIIWFPLVFFAFGNTVGQPNPPTDVTVKIRIGPFLPVYQMSAQSHNIYSFTEQDYTHLSNMYARDRTAQTFLSNYMYNDVAVVTLNPNSTMMWAISPPEQDRLEHEAASNATLKVKFTFVITHPSNTVQNPPTIEDSREVSLPAYKADGTRNPERDILYNMLLDKSDADTWLTVPTLFPKFLKVFNKGTAKPAYQLTPPTQDEDPETPSDARLYRSVQMRLERDRGTMYWRVREMCTKKDPLVAIPKNNCDMLMMYTFNDKLFPETLNFISGGGIIGLYTTFVFLASRVIRGFFTGIYTKIMFDDLPNVDRVLQLCLDIYLVREALELTLEEDLFAKLVFLYRSPETMIKWTRPKDEDLREEEHRALPPSR